MRAANPAPASGRRHCCFRHGLWVLFSDGGAPPRGTAVPPDPAPPPCPPERAASSGHGPREQQRSLKPSGASRPGRPACGAGWLGAGPSSTPSGPPPAKRRLTRYALDPAASRAWAALGADRPSPVLSRMRARAATRAGLQPARTKRSSRPRSSGVSRTGNFSRTMPPPHSNTIRHQHSIPTERPESHPKSSLTGY